MARQFSMPYQIPPVILLPAAADAAGRTGSYRDLRNALKAYVVVEVNQGNAATVALTLLQGQDVTGTGSKAVGVTPIWLVTDTSVSDALIAQAAAAGFTTSATLKDKLVVFEIEPEACLDLANNFKTIAVQTGASNAANITSAKLFVLQAIQGASAPTTYA
jgi:hypothetical protein